MSFLFCHQLKKARENSLYLLYDKKDKRWMVSKKNWTWCKMIKKFR